MYARVTFVQVAPDDVEESIRLFDESVIPAARQEEGFHGAMLLVRDNGEAMAIDLADNPRAPAGQRAQRLLSEPGGEVPRPDRRAPAARGLPRRRVQARAGWDRAARGSVVSRSAGHAATRRAPVPPPRRREPGYGRRDDNRRLMVEAMERLLAHGASYAELTIEQIAHEAGLSRTSFYFLFRDKRDLLEAAAGEPTGFVAGAAERWLVEASSYDPVVGDFWRELVGRYATGAGGCATAGWRAASPPRSSPPRWCG